MATVTELADQLLGVLTTTDDLTVDALKQLESDAPAIIAAAVAKGKQRFAARIQALKQETARLEDLTKDL